MKQIWHIMRKTFCQVNSVEATVTRMPRRRVASEVERRNMSSQERWEVGHITLGTRWNTKKVYFYLYRQISILFVGQISLSIVSFVIPKILKMKLQTPSIKSCRCSLWSSSYGEQRAQSSAL